MDVQKLLKTLLSEELKTNPCVLLYNHILGLNGFSRMETNKLFFLLQFRETLVQ